MSKIIIVDLCDECPHYSNCKHASSLMRYLGAVDFPEECPLDDEKILLGGN